MNQHIQIPPPGRCTLVGAGPGHVDLLTAQARAAIEAATLLLVDDLVGPHIVALASPQAQVVYVGKRGGCRSTPQAQIEQRMIEGVQQGHHVVRLKGGDPFVFGRGGEEAEHLRAAGVQVQVVNGITAGLAAATALGVPLTHRQHAQGVVFVTGHTQPQGQDMDWGALGACAQQLKLTLVIYMGIRGVLHIQEGLLLNMPAHTPAAVVQNASLPTQQHIVTRLDQLVDALAQSGLGSPAVIVLGNVLAGLAAVQSKCR